MHDNAFGVLRGVCLYRKQECSVLFDLGCGLHEKQSLLFSFSLWPYSK